MRKLLPEQRRPKPQIVVTNLIDVILLLVFFFMITSSFAQDKRQVPVELPQAGSASIIDAELMTIQVDKAGAVLWTGKPVSSVKLEHIVSRYLGTRKDRPVLLEADQGVSYGHVMTALDTIRRAGSVNISLATQAAHASTKH